MKTSLLSCIFLLIVSSSFAQINKSKWLIGGSGTYSSYKSFYDQTEKNNNLQLNSGAGYFFINKLATGVRFGYAYYQQIGESVNGHYKQSDRYINLGPFVRYYFLPANKKLNVLADAAFYYGWDKSKNLGGYSKERKSGYTFSAGPAWFFTPHTSLELTLNYKKADEAFYKSSGINVNIGFQIHI